MNEYEPGKQTKKLLISAAGELASELGFSNVSTRAIAERAGENIGSIHYHFGGKDALFKEVVKTATADILESPLWNVIDELDSKAISPQILSETIRKIVHRQIEILFNPDKPRWHSRVIYQLLQFEGELNDIFMREILDPDMDAMRKFFKMIKPDMPDDETLLRSLLLQMPVFAHANYMTAILKILGAASYSDEYLMMLENLLVQQTQLILGLPLTDRSLNTNT